MAPADFGSFDLILAMDRVNEETLKARAPRAERHRIALLLELALGERTDVPDPCYGGDDGFEDVYRMLRSASAALARKLVAEAGALSG